MEKYSLNERINDKINEIEKYLEELISITPEGFREYSEDFRAKAACERFFEKIVEAAVDLAFLVIKSKKLDIPEGDKETFDILAKKGIITKDLAANLKDAKSMRNILAHEYGNVNDKLVFHSLTAELEKDINEFLEEIMKEYKK